jgi:phosphatidylserine/phosphatidylglycerophosphate/cardiolipin synthase-like enzyme
MTMYALEDPTFTSDLLAACKRGVTVRVILDQNLEKSGNTSAFTQLNAQPHCGAVWANKAFQATHEKSFIIDGTKAAIMSLNLQPQYYSTTRDFAMIENDPADVAAIAATFSADFAAGTTASGTSGASDFNYTPGSGSHLIWSPPTAQTAMVNLIAFAKKTLLIENEELASSATAILTALETACKNGVQLQVAMVNNTSYASSFAAITKAGCSVHTYPDSTTGFYIHAKAVVADYGLPTQNAYMGSINYSSASMNSNRELGMFVTDEATITSLHDTMLADYNGGTTYAAK